jgi:hypothetical protein
MYQRMIDLQGTSGYWKHPPLPQVRNDRWKRLRRRAASPIAVIATLRELLRELLLSWLGPGRHARGVTSAAPGHRGT